MYKYSWEKSIECHLNDFRILRQPELNHLRGFRRFGVLFCEALDLSEKFDINSIEFSNELMKMIFDNMGDYENLKPYGPNSFEKLTDDQREFLQTCLDQFLSELQHIKKNRLLF